MKHTYKRWLQTHQRPVLMCGCSSEDRQWVITAQLVSLTFCKACFDYVSNAAYYHYFFFYWSIVALQCCVSSGWTTEGISSTCTYSPYPLSLPLTQPPIPPISVITEPWAELPVRCIRFPLAVCFAHDTGHTSVLLSQSIPLSSSPAVSACLF